MKKRFKILAIALMTAMVFGGMTAVTAPTIPQTVKAENDEEILDVSTVDNDGKDTVVELTDDTASSINLVLKNTSGSDLTITNIKLSDSNNALEGTPSDYDTDFKISAGESKNLYANKTGWIFFRGSGEGRKKLTLNCTIKGQDDPVSLDFYVLCKDSGSSDDDDDDDSSDGGSYSNDSGSSGGASTPRVIITGFETKPANVKAGETFTLTVHMKNTSRKQKVGNLLFDFQADSSSEDSSDSSSGSTPAFLPTSGSSTVYLDKIGANQTADVSIELTADNSLTQAPYPIEIGIKYENSDYESLESTSSLTIPVKQDARYEFTGMELTPETISLGSEANVMGTINNMGRTTLYNARVNFEGVGIEAEDSYIGNIGAGSTASIDAMLTGTELTEGPEEVTMVFTYEDSDGKVITDKSQVLELEVSEDVDMGDFDEMAEDEGSSFSIIPIIIVLIILLAIGIAGYFLWKERKKRKAKMQEADEFSDEFDDDEFDDEDDDE